MKLEVSDATNAQAYSDIVKNLDTAQSQAKALANRSTVYLQFAEGTRARAKELSAKLAADGFVMPGEERHAGASGKREVRYYYEADLQGANSLADATTKALVSMGYSNKPDVKVSDLTSYSGNKPKAGIIELWIGL